MDVLMMLPLAAAVGFVFVFGTVAGSFLNVLVARLPFEKSVFWPGSRCFSCLQPLGLRDNLPVVGYLLLRGRCRTCRAPFSSRYLWVELGTGLALTGLFVVEILLNWQHLPGRSPTGAYPPVVTDLLPPPKAVAFFALHGALLLLLIAAAVVDAEYRVIPPQITYVGTVLGLAGSTLFPWPWPTAASDLAPVLADRSWMLPEAGRALPTGATLWPFAGPPPAWAPPGSWRLGLATGLVGAAAGTLVVRAVKFLFETGIGKEALGLGDADLLMMAGAFLGWQVAVLGFFAGAVAALVLRLPTMVAAAVRGRPVGGELPFGPGLAVGVVLTWLGWPWVSGFARLLFDPTLVAVFGGAMGGGLLIAGLLLRRR